MTNPMLITESLPTPTALEEKRIKEHGDASKNLGERWRGVTRELNSNWAHPNTMDDAKSELRGDEASSNQRRAEESQASRESKMNR